MVSKTTTVANLEQGPDKAALPEGMDVKTGKVRTPGWKLFDFIVHWGINWVGNTAGGIWTAHQLTNYKINKKIDAAEKNPSDTSGYRGEAHRKLAFENTTIPLTEKLTGKKRNYYELVDWFDENVSGKFWEKANTKMGGVMDPDTKAAAQEITTDVLLLTNPGHITTAITQLFENRYVKPKMVRWLDENVTDPIRNMFGKGPTKTELAEREVIYTDKLDGELAGKSFIGTWGARWFAIGTIIASLFTLRQADKYTIGKDTEPQYLGLKRLKQGVLKGAEFLHQRKVAGEPFGYTAPFKDDNAPAAKKFYAEEMSKMFATEIVGSSMSAGTQYLYLMAREFFGVGPKTSLENRKHSTPDKHKQTQASNARQPNEEAQPQQEAAAHQDNSTNRYTEKNRPIAPNYQARAESRNTLSMEQGLS